LACRAGRLLAGLHANPHGEQGRIHSDLLNFAGRVVASTGNAGGRCRIVLATESPRKEHHRAAESVSNGPDVNLCPSSTSVLRPKNDDRRMVPVAVLLHNHLRGEGVAVDEAWGSRFQNACADHTKESPHGATEGDKPSGGALDAASQVNDDDQIYW